MRKNNESTLGEVLQKFLLSDKIKEKYIRMRIDGLWRDLMGPAIAAHTTRIVYRKGDLFVSVDSAPLRHELTNGKDKLQDLINRSLPFAAIQRIFIR